MSEIVAKVAAACRIATDITSSNEPSQFKMTNEGVKNGLENQVNPYNKSELEN